MPRDFGLGTAQDLHEVANADLLIVHKVQQPEPGVVSQRLKEPLYVVRLLCCHDLCIRIDVFEGKSYSRQSRCVEDICQSSYLIR